MQALKAFDSSQTENIFIVDTTFQLLNAIEASKHLLLSRNFLLVLNQAGQTSDAYQKAIDQNDWVRVTYAWITISTEQFKFTMLGPRVGGIALKWYSRYLNLQRMRKVGKIARSFGQVDNIFLGHYWAEQKAYMMHFANSIRHKNLFILDDGTDVLDIASRRGAYKINREPCNIRSEAGNSMLQRAIANLRRKYWTWDVGEAETLTFFTSYDLHICTGDHLIKNDYRHLRSLAAIARQNESIYFLGQCLVEDGLMDREVYLEYLRGVKSYFSNEKIQYVPHPRESVQTTTSVRQFVGVDIVKFDVPIEHQLVTDGEIPKAVASFFCSALESCSIVFADKMKFVCFYIFPEHLKKTQKNVQDIYEYFGQKANDSFVIVKLEGIGRKDSRGDA